MIQLGVNFSSYLTSSEAFYPAFKSWGSDSITLWLLSLIFIPRNKLAVSNAVACVGGSKELVVGSRSTLSPGWQYYQK